MTLLGSLPEKKTCFLTSGGQDFFRPGHLCRSTVLNLPLLQALTVAYVTLPENRLPQESQIFDFTAAQLAVRRRHLECP